MISLDINLFNCLYCIVLDCIGESHSYWRLYTRPRVCQLYSLLVEWPPVSADIAIILLGVRYFDSVVQYLRRTLAVDKTREEALQYFETQLYEAHGGAWTTKLDWFFHSVKHT